MRLDSLFAVAYGNKFDFNKMTPEDGGIAFVGRSGVRQGISGRVARRAGVEPYSGGNLTVALGGASRLATFVQQEPFYTAQNVAVLSPLSPMTLEEKLYWAMCIKANRFRYEGFGREANRTLSSLDLPDEIPAWVQEFQVPPAEGLLRPIEPHVDLRAKDSWKDFRLDVLFDIKKGRRLTKADRIPGATRFIGASERNNGVTDYISAEPQFEAGCLTVPYNGSVGWAFYQDAPFLASDDVNVLVPRAETSALALIFVAAVIRHGKSRYTYGYKWNLERMGPSTVRLPSTEAGEPDWAYMEAYIKGLPFSELAQLP